MKYTLLTLLGSAAMCSATVTVTGGAVFDMKGPTLLDTPAIGDLFAIVVSTTDNTFDTVNAGATLSVGQALNGGDDIVIATGGLVDAGGNRAAQATFSNLALTGNLSAGDQFAIYWFPGVTTAGSATVAGSNYGMTRAANWVLPVDGATEAVDNVTGSQLANLTVAPEPSSIALLGLGALGFAARRRRA